MDSQVEPKRLVGTWARAWWLIIPAVVASFLLFGSDPSGFSSQQVDLPRTTTLPAPPEILLTPDGFGPATFGEPIESVLADVSELLSSPVEDIDQPCREDEGRWIRWGNLSALARESTFVGFIVGIYFRQDSPAIGVRTEEGLVLGATGRDLQDRYGDRLQFSEPVGGFEDGDARSFGVDGYVLGTSTQGLGGYLEGDIDTGKVVTIVGGDLCSFPPGS